MELLDRIKIALNNSNEWSSFGTAYAIVTWHEFDNIERLYDSIIYVSQYERRTEYVLNYLNNKLKDEDILTTMIGHSEDNAQNRIQTNVRTNSFYMVELCDFELKRYYNITLRKKVPDVRLYYNVICIETMINQNIYVHPSARHEKYLPDKVKLFKKIRSYFSNKNII